MFLMSNEDNCLAIYGTTVFRKGWVLEEITDLFS